MRLLYSRRFFILYLFFLSTIVALRTLGNAAPSAYDKKASRDFSSNHAASVSAWCHRQATPKQTGYPDYIEIECAG